EYDAPVVHVADASRAVDVVSNLLSDGQRTAFDRANRDDQERVRQQHHGLKRRPMLPIADARANRPDLPWTAATIATPGFTGSRVVDIALEEVIPFIDWTFFFSAWELKGRFPAILDHSK